MNSSSFGGRRNLLGFVMLSQAFALLVLLIYRNKLLLLRDSHLAASQEVMAAQTRSLLLSFMEGFSPAAVVGLVYMVCGTLVSMNTEPYDCIIEPLFCIRYIFSFLFSCEYFLLWIYSCDIRKSHEVSLWTFHVRRLACLRCVTTSLSWEI